MMMKTTFGATRTPLPKDIVLGRGGMANNHVGNKMYREVIDMYTMEYHSTDFLESKTRKAKDEVVRKVLGHLKNDGYRFVEKSPNKLWHEAPRSKARLKVVQALREGALAWRLNMEHATKRRPSPIFDSNGDNLKLNEMVDLVKSNAEKWDRLHIDASASIVTDTSSLASLADEEDSFEDTFDLATHSSYYVGIQHTSFDGAMPRANLQEMLDERLGLDIQPLPLDQNGSGLDAPLEMEMAEILFEFLDASP